MQRQRRSKERDGAHARSALAVLQLCEGGSEAAVLLQLCMGGSRRRMGVRAVARPKGDRPQGGAIGLAGRVRFRNVEYRHKHDLGATDWVLSLRWHKLVAGARRRGG